MAINATADGNLTREPELRYAASGQAMATFGVASSRRFQRNGEWEEKTTFLNCICFGELAENAAQSLSKGARVIITGYLEQNDYENEEGEKRTSMQFVVQDLAPSLRWATAQVEKVARQTQSR